MEKSRIIKVIENNKGLITNFVISFFVLTALFGGLLRRAFNADTITYMVYAKDDADVRVRAGRYLVAFFDVIFYKLGIKTTDFMPVWIFLSLIILALTVVVLSEVLKRFHTSDNMLYAVGVSLSLGLGFYNVLFSEYFMFTEVTFFYTLGFLIAAIGVCCFVRSGKGKVLAYILFALAACTYQYTVVFAAIVLAFYYMLLHDFKWSKKAVIDELLGVALPMSTGIICMISIKIVGQIYPDLASVKSYSDESVRDKLGDIIDSIGMFLKDSYGLLPGRFIPAVVLLTSICVCVYLIAKAKGMQGVLLFSAVCLGSLVLMLIIPMLGAGFNFPPRMSFCLYLVQGMIFVTIMSLQNAQESLLRAVTYLVMGYVWIQMLGCSFITSGRYVSNTLDKNYSQIILKEIEKYEAETGITVSKLGICTDGYAPAYYEESKVHYGQINERVIGQATRSLIEAVWGRRFEGADGVPADVYEEYFAGKNWDYFDVNEQLVIVDDTAYLCVY